MACYRTMDFLARHDSRLVSLFVGPFALALGQYRGRDAIYRLPLEWLDQMSTAIRKTLAPEHSGYSHGPLVNGVQSAEHVRVPAVKLYEFNDAGVFAASSAIIVNGTIILERIEDIDLKRASYRHDHIVFHGRKSAFLRVLPAENLDAGIFLAGNGSYNYYHWTIEILVKLQFLPELDELYPRFPLLVSDQLAGIDTLRQGLAFIVGNTRPIVLLDHNKLYNIGKLVYVNAPNGCPYNIRAGQESRISDFRFRASSIFFLRNRFGVEFCPAENTKKRIFFARKGERRRYNEDEVRPLFERRGFTFVFMEDLSLQSQIDLVSSAEMLAGPTGASWTNLIFCRAGTRCLCWMAQESTAFAAYSNLAKIVGAELHYINYPTGAKSTDELYSMDYRLDSMAVEMALDKIITG